MTGSALPVEVFAGRHMFKYKQSSENSGALNLSGFPPKSVIILLYHSTICFVWAHAGANFFACLLAEISSMG